MSIKNKGIYGYINEWELAENMIYWETLNISFQCQGKESVETKLALLMDRMVQHMEKYL